jgi:hypothetical protein
MSGEGSLKYTMVTLSTSKHEEKNEEFVSLVSKSYKSYRRKDGRKRR